MSAFAIYQALANGIVTGCVYALVAMSLVIIFKATDIVNFAVGEVIMVGAYLGALALIYFEFTYVLVFVFAAVGMFAIGALFDGVVLRRVIARARAGQNLLVTLVIATVGLSYVLKGAARPFSFTEEPRRLDPAFPGAPIDLGPLILQRQDIAIVVISMILVVGLFAFFQFTFTGKALRATSQNARAASLVGIPVPAMRVMTWGISCALAGIAGVLIGAKLPMTVDMGGSLILMSFAAAVLGGFTSLPGTIVGGVLLGIVQNLVGITISTHAGGVSPFVVIMLVLIFRPQGLFGGHSGAKKV